MTPRKAYGSLYVLVVFASLAGYTTYQWWFNPNRAIKRQLGELAATLSVAPDEPNADRLARSDRTRDYFAQDVRVRLGRGLPDLDSRDALADAIARWTPPPGGVNVDFVDVQIAVDPDGTARAYMTVEVRRRDQATGQTTYDTGELKAGFVQRDGVWLISTAERTDTQRP